MPERRITLSIEGSGDEHCERCPRLVRATAIGGAEFRLCSVWRHDREPLDGRRWPECIAAEGREAGEDGYRVTLTPIGECGRGGGK